MQAGHTRALQLASHSRDVSRIMSGAPMKPDLRFRARALHLLALLLAAGGFAQAARAADAYDPRAWETGNLGLFPGLFHHQARANIFVVTEYMPGARKFPKPSADHPVYYEGDLTAVTEAGDPVAGLQPPSQQAVLAVLNRALKAAGLAPWGPGHHAQVYLRVWWGLFNRLSDIDRSSRAQAAPQTVGGVSYGDLAQASNLYDRALMVGGSAFASQYLNYINETAELKVPPMIRHLNDEQFYMASPHNLDLAQETRTDRYFIVVGAYDARALAEGRWSLLWRTMISTNARGRSFKDSIASIVSAAGPYIGHPTDGAVRLNRPLVPAGRVTVGTPVPVGFKLDSPGAASGAAFPGPGAALEAK